MLGKGPASARAVCQCELLPEKSQGVHLSLTGILLGLWGWGRLHAGLPQFTDLEHPELAVLQRTAGDLAEGMGGHGTGAECGCQEAYVPQLHSFFCSAQACACNQRGVSR